MIKTACLTDRVSSYQLLVTLSLLLALISLTWMTMFNFFKKRREEQAAKLAEESVMSRLLEDANKGNANPLELALAIHDKEPSKESFARLILALTTADVFTLNASHEKWGDMAVLTFDADMFIALFSSPELAHAAVQSPYDQVQKVSTLELAFNTNDQAGWVFNPGTPLVTGLLTVPMLSAVRRVLESTEVQEGGLYTVWTKGLFRAVQILKTDDTGVHLRLYPGAWQDRPTVLHVPDLPRPDEEPHGIGHLPFTRKSFFAMGPKLASSEAVAITEEDLEGYRMWQENKGGYFGS